VKFKEALRSINEAIEIGTVEEYDWFADYKVCRELPDYEKVKPGFASICKILNEN
jgi:hypothetical protein